MKNWRLFYPEIKIVAPKKQPSRLLQNKICHPHRFYQAKNVQQSCQSRSHQLHYWLFIQRLD
ncbi:hypothetical protein AEST_10730 [Alishewanella aestuarii B11]|uniref:Uncharacterized protein n=1 Tax=Alishewanella aestuarii B11 TaxID=1197174 RepID=J1QK88_9ALTE|nr:hypothetical protein AEST_10730 [Alishewanella aestuarii B11]